MGEILVREDCQHSLTAGRNVRPLSTADMGPVMKLELQSYSHPWTEAVFLDCFKPNYRLWALDQGGELIGYAVVAYLFDEAHVLNLCTGPAHRRTGAARLLLRYLVTAAAHDSMCRMILEVRKSNHAAINLYIHEGFEPVGARPGYYPAAGGREDACVMALPLLI